MISKELKPSDLLEIMRKVKPRHYAHIVFLIKDGLRLIASDETTNGCQGHDVTAASKQNKEDVS